MTSARSPRLEQRRDLVRELLVRDVRLRYRGSILGLFWSQVGPLVTIVVLSTVFTRVVPLGIRNYPVFLYVGLSTWQWFQGGFVSATGSIPNNRDLVRHPAFPVWMLPPVAIGSYLVQYLLALPIVLGAVILFTGRLPLTVLALPAVLVVQFAVCLGPSYILSALHTSFRDTAEVVSIAMSLIFYATPIIYDEHRLVSSRLRLLYQVNPMAHLISAQRDAVLFGRWPDGRKLLVIGLLAVVVLVVGIRMFVAAEARFPEKI